MEKKQCVLNVWEAIQMEMTTAKKQIRLKVMLQGTICNDDFLAEHSVAMLEQRYNVRSR